MAEGGQGFYCTEEGEPQDLIIDPSESMGYDWCNLEGNYCDAVPGSTSFTLISFALIPLALVLGIYIFCRLIWIRSNNNDHSTPEDANYPEDDQTVDYEEKEPSK